MVEIICTNGETPRRSRFPLGTSLAQIASEMKISLKYPTLGALVNNKVKELSYQVFKPKQIEFFDISHNSGYQMTLRSLSFVLFHAVKQVYPQAVLVIQHSISGGKYCEFENLGVPLNQEVVDKIKEKMHDIVEQDIPFVREQLLTSEALALFEKHELYDKSLLFRSRNTLYTSVYKLRDSINYYYGFLMPSTRYVKVFNLELYHQGMLLQPPSKHNPEQTARINPQVKLFNVFQEHKKWVSILGVPHVGELNVAVEEKRTSELIQVSEALHEKSVAAIADDIHRHENVKMVLISGPSSSGKTTFCKRLSVQLEVLGYKPVQVSIDNYFVERDETPRDSHGEFDFECLQAIDLHLFNTHLSELLLGNYVEIPTFDFAAGKKVYNGNKLKMNEKSILILEGIHGLNPQLTAMIENKFKYKIFVSALTQIAIDNQNPIPTTDNRLIRRIVRDYRYRGYSAYDTLKRWGSVRKGEEKWIFPFQEQADVMFNSALLCELSLLKYFAEPILRDVPETVPQYAEAVRLLKFLSYFKAISEHDVPPTSILREFFGGSSFVY
jgi:uridine kinase